MMRIPKSMSNGELSHLALATPASDLSDCALIQRPGTLTIIGLLALTATMLITQTPRPHSVSHQPFESARGCTLCLYGPDNMVFDNSGNAYLVDTDHKTHSRVLKLTTEGEKLAEWSFFPVAAGSRSGPEGIALDREGNVFVTDAASNVVLKVSTAGRVLSKLGGRQVFKDLGHVAISTDGRLFVSEGPENRIQEFSRDGKLIRSIIRRKGDGPDEWNDPQSIVSLDRETIALEDWGNRRIEILATSGQVLRIIGRSGKGLGELSNSAGIAVTPHGELFVADFALNKIVEFDLTGRLVREIKNTSGQVLFEDRPAGIAVDPHGYLFSPDGLSIVKYTRDGRVLSRWR
jgi:DNA-binding beta-propeller fold protein YncE